MARLIPRIKPADIKNPGERRVAEALLAQLPSGVEVFHSFAYLSTNTQGKAIEGECDFVVLDPDHGLLFVEVKGGALSWDPARGVWRRVTPGGHTVELNKDPVAQARQGMHEVVDRIRVGLPTPDGQLPFTYGYAMAFPDCQFSGSLPAGLAQDLLLDAKRCQELKPAIERAFDRWRQRVHPPLGGLEIQAIHHALLPQFDLLPVIWRKVEDQEERLRRMTEEQEKVLAFLGNHRLAAIQGVAGSGKTILAVAKAQQMARSGARTLLLCYNRALKDWLVQAVAEVAEGRLVIDNYHGLAEDLCRKATLPFVTPGQSPDAQFWSEVAPERLVDACQALGPEHKFDAIVVDEGQDFQELWWASLEEVFRNPAEKRCYYVFFDPNQNLFGGALAIPGELGTPYSLTVNCRNTVRIAEHCAALVGIEHQVHATAPEGDDPVMTESRSLKEAFQVAGRSVRKWCMPQHGGLRLSQVAVLAPGSAAADWPEDFKTIKTTRDLDRWRAGEAVLITSPGKFKGLEADAVIIIEAPKSDPELERTNRYVARSRAKHLLEIIQLAE